MPFLEAVRIALGSLRANKLRALLTVLGILIGVSSVVAVVAITEGLDRYIAEQVLDLGGKSFSVRKVGFTTNRDLFLEMLKRKDITLDDMEWVRRACDACAEVGGVVRTSQSVKWGRNTQSDVEILGVTENYARIGSVRELTAGRPLVEDDVRRARPVAVLGPDVATALFGAAEPLGKRISVQGAEVTVVGVTEGKGKIFGESQDNFLWIPITAYYKLFGARRSVTIEVEARSMERVEEAQDQVRVAMRARRHLGFRKPDDFSVETGESILELWQSATRGIYVVTIVVTAISLLVGGIVVMNIMLVSVTERVHEIGVRKALGARRGDILRQFLVESVVLSILGGALGVLGAVAFSLLLARVLGGIMATDFTAPIRFWAVGTALAVASFVGLVAGIYPASRAAALDPVESLRSE